MNKEQKTKAVIPTLLTESTVTTEETATKKETAVVSNSAEAQKQKLLKSGFLKKNFGVEAYAVFDEIVSGALKGLPHYASIASEGMNTVALSIQEMKPSDAVEAKLCAKEVSLYSLAMQYIRRAEAGMFSEDSDMASRMWYETNMNYAIKLLRLHNETVETLSRYRRKGEQKVVVQHQHVQVNDGGKAIVGTNLSMGGGGQL